MKNIICISGKQYSGKDTLAKVIMQALPVFKRVAIGDAIKIEYGKLNNLTYDEIDKNKGVYRTGLIELGNKGRNIHPDFWLNKIIELDYSVIVPDVRLIHEAEVFKNAGACLIRVEACYETRSKRGVITNADDITECELDNYSGFDYIISNESGEKELSINAAALINLLKDKFKL